MLFGMSGSSSRVPRFYPGFPSCWAVSVLQGARARYLGLFGAGWACLPLSFHDDVLVTRSREQANVINVLTLYPARSDETVEAGTSVRQRWPICPSDGLSHE